MTFPIEPSAKTEPLPSVSRPLSPEISPTKISLFNRADENGRMDGWMNQLSIAGCQLRPCFLETAVNSL